MNQTASKILHWTPRVLAILLILFVSLFALDVFGEGYTWWEAIIGFLIHLVPTYLLIIALVMAWKWPRNGGTLFIALSVAYVAMFWSPDNLAGVTIMSVPTFVIGLLFVINHYVIYNKEEKKHVKGKPAKR